MSWLPDRDWVLEHWLPYNEGRLYARLHVDRGEVLRYLRTGEHPLADLVRSKGIDPRKLQRDLAAPWRGKVSKRRYATLYRRTGKTLTQRHLAQHLIGHAFHQRSLHDASPEIFGMDYGMAADLRRSGLSWADVGAHGGRSHDEVRAAILRTFRRSAANGVRRHAIPRSQARRWVAFHVTHVDRWLETTPGPRCGCAQDGAGAAPDHGTGHEHTGRKAAAGGINAQPGGSRQRDAATIRAVMSALRQP